MDLWELPAIGPSILSSAKDLLSVTFGSPARTRTTDMVINRQKFFNFIRLYRITSDKQVWVYLFDFVVLFLICLFCIVR